MHTGTKGPLQHPMITKKLGKEKVRVCVHFLPVTSLFGIHLFLVHKNYYPSIIHFVFHNIHLTYYISPFVHFWVAITNFVLLDHCSMDANVDHTSLLQILDLPYESPKEQFMLLSSISNFHKFGYPAMSELSSKSVISPSHIMYAEHVLHNPFSKEDMKGNDIRKYIPVSPHNQIMYFLATFKEADMYYLLQYLLLKDQGTDDPNMEYEHLKFQDQERRGNTQQDLCQSHKEQFCLKLVLTLMCN